MSPTCPHVQTSTEHLSTGCMLGAPAGQLRLLACNNDHTVKVFDLPSMRHLDTIACPVAVNYAALSPDGRLLAAVGDASETYLFRATPSG